MSPDIRIPTQLVTCTAADYLLGIDVLQVQEVLKHQRMTTVPRAAREVLGLINLRGHIVTAIGMRERLHLELREDKQDCMNLVVTLRGGAASLLVDSVGEVIDLDPKFYKPCPSNLTAPLSDIVSGVYQVKGGKGLLLHIDPESACYFESGREATHEQ